MMNSTETTAAPQTRMSWLDALKVYKESATLRMLALGAGAIASF
jgi:hypothetical protein